MANNADIDIVGLTYGFNDEAAPRGLPELAESDWNDEDPQYDEESGSYFERVSAAYGPGKVIYAQGCRTEWTLLGANGRIVERSGALADILAACGA